MEIIYKKRIALIETSMNKFHNEYRIYSIEKPAFNSDHVQILGETNAYKQQKRLNCPEKHDYTKSRKY